MAFFLDFNAPLVPIKSRLLDFGEDDFESIFQRTLELEGGFVEDEGGPTNLGITQTTLNSFYKQKNLPTEDVKFIQPEKAKQVFKEEFFERPKFNKLPSRVGSLQFDFGVQSGPARAVKSLQKIVGVTPDGIIGPKTINATENEIKRSGEQSLLQKLIDDRVKFIKKTPAYKRVPRGLMNRIQKIKDEFNLSSLNPFAATSAEAGEVGRLLDFDEPETPDTDVSEIDRIGEIAVQQALDKNFEKMVADVRSGVTSETDFVGDALDILSGGMTIEEAEQHRDVVIEKAKRIIPSQIAIVKNVADNFARNLRTAKRYIDDPIRALKGEDIPEKTIDPTEALEGFSNIFEFIFNPFIKQARAIGGFIFPEDEGTLKTRLTQAAKDVIKDPGAGFIAERLGEDIFTGEEETIERIAKIGGVATVGFIAEILTFNPRGIFNRIKRFPTDQKIARMNEIIAEVDKDVPALKEMMRKVRPDLPPHVVEGLEARDFIIGAQSNPQLGNYLKAVTNKIAPRFTLASERAAAQIPFKKGDIVKIGKEIGTFIKESAGKALVEIAGKEVTRELSEIVPEKPVEARPVEGKEVVEPITELKEPKPITPGKVKLIISEVTGLKPIEKPLTTTERSQLKFKLRQQVKAAKLGFKEGKGIEKAKQKQKIAIKEINQIKDTQTKIDAAFEIEGFAPEPFQSQSSAFNEHVAYFQAKQLPPNSQVRSILKRIRTITRLRRSGKIKPSQANRVSKRLRKELFVQAKKENVAIRLTDGGKIVLAIRDSGVFVSQDFANYKKFKDTAVIAGGGTDTTRLIQQMDGSLTETQKVLEPGQAGPLERNVLWPSRDMSIQKLNYEKEKKIILKRIFSGVKRKSAKGELINQVAELISLNDLSIPAETLVKRDDIKKLTDNTRIVQQAKDLRVWFTDTIGEINSARQLRNQEIIPVRDKYVPHEFLDQTLWEMYGPHAKNAKEIIDSPILPSYIKPNKPFNPREKAREFGIPYEDRIKDPIVLSENYLGTAMKDIFNTSIIQNNKAYIQQLETMGFKNSASTLAEWTSEAYAGIPPALDKAVNLPAKFNINKPLSTFINKQGMRWFNRVRNLGVFPFNFSWNVFVQTSSFTTLTLTRLGAINTAQGMLSWMKPSTRERVAKEYYTSIVKSHNRGQLSRQETEQLLGENVKIYKTPLEIIEDFQFLISDNIERTLTGMSIEAGRFRGEKLGLKGEALKQFASDAGGKTQTMYNLEDRAGVTRNLIVRTAFPYQTFGFEVMNTLKEWTGRTGTPPGTQMERLFWMIRFIVGATISAALAKKAGRTLWDWTRPPLPYAEQWLNPIIRKFTGEHVPESRVLPSPVQMTAGFAVGIDNVLERGDWRKLRTELIKWAPGTVGVGGGIQASRMVDSIIAYSQGGIYDKSGRKMFGIETKQELLHGMFSGVWSTRGGQERLKKMKGAGLFGDKIDIKQILDNIGGLTPQERRVAAKKRRKIKALKRKQEKVKGVRKLKF